MGISKEVIICEACKGSGKKTWEELTDYHKGEYVTRSKKCDSCNGSGRLLKVTKTEYIPYE